MWVLAKVRLRNGKPTLRLGVRCALQTRRRGLQRTRRGLGIPRKLGALSGRSVARVSRSVSYRPVPRMIPHRYVIAQWKREIAGAHGNFQSVFRASDAKWADICLQRSRANLLSSTRGPRRDRRGCDPETEQTRILAAVNDGWEPATSRRSTRHAPSEITVTDAGRTLAASPARTGWISPFTPGPDQSGDGRIELFVNGAWVMSATGRIGHGEEERLGPRQYFKFGPYRGACTWMYGAWTTPTIAGHLMPLDVLGRDVPELGLP